ncbi:MAG: hypothetical protein ABIK92_21580 [Pseudomonadota bacterium]
MPQLDSNRKITEMLFESVIISQKNKKILERNAYQIKILDINYLPQIMELHQLIIDRLIRKDTLQPFTLDFMKEHLGSKGVIIGVIFENKLIAFRNIYFPDADEKEWNLGIDLGFAKNILHKVANLQMVCVHPFYRGNSLAMIMNRHAIKMIKISGTYDHICATVSPYNYWNLKILLESGFVIKKLTTKYGDKLRYIVHLDLKNPLCCEPGYTEYVSLTDFTRQHKLHSKGWYGTSLSISKKSGNPSSYEKMLLGYCK